ncbi:SLBB domain-containing protein [Pelobacter seleniigenes]|uniref:SLBB domain-containing protein n=1 Tax=Pelobacter seleniigenes TaxID=407188 RepID=UPI001FDEE3D2|nr:SLBB domain-containing protein [Pelobacter seleniigenes]
MKFGRLLFLQILIVGVFLFPTVAFSQVMPTEIGATSLQSTAGYRNVIKTLTPDQQKQLAEYQQMLRQLSPEQQELLQQYQNNSADAGGANEHIEYDATGMSEQNRDMRQDGGTNTGSGDPDASFGSNLKAVGSPGVEFSKSDKVSLASSAEKYFSGLAKEKKSPRAQVPQDLTVLKQFGFEFFANTEGFKADPMELAGPDYVLGPGDALRVDVWGNIEGHYQTVIDRNGEIVLPKVGVINLLGETFAQAKDTINNQIGKYFKQYQVNVSLDSLRSINVFLVGEVQAPGTYQVSSLSSVLAVLSEAGGPTKNGSLRNISVLRQGKQLARIDLYDFFRSGDSSQDVRLQAGDTILVPIAGSLVGISGDVRRPAIYELTTGETLGDLLDMAGGIVSTAYLQKIRLQRVADHNRNAVIDLSLSGPEEKVAETLKYNLQDRDLVQIAPITDAGGYVSLTGYVARPGEYQLEPGMRLADLLLPYGNLLPEYYPQKAQLIRTSPPEYRQELLTINLQQALDGDSTQNLLLQEYDEVQLFSRQEMEELPQVTVSGAVLRPGQYPLFDNMSIVDLVTAAGNLKRSAYLDMAELTRYLPSGTETKVERYEINLANALNGQPQNNMKLEPNDHLIIRSIPDYQDRFMVKVSGAVLFPGDYAIGKGETLSSVLERAGGYTDKAYLRGAVFSRESLKEVQKKQIDKLIAEEQKQLSRIAENIAIGAMSAEEAKSAETLLANRKMLIEDLKKAPVTGRLVIDLASIENLKGSPQDIVLMDGDSLLVPENPQTINIQGEVYNSTSLNWEPGKTVGYYLDKVGGTKETANKEEMFVVRADGTVVSKQQSGHSLGWDKEKWRWTFGGFENTVLYPGDSILVPEEYKQYDWLRETKDITTILYQMALGAAAVASF